MTMTHDTFSLADGWTGKEASPTGRAEVDRRCAVAAGGSGLACFTFLLSLKGPALLCCVRSLADNEMAPGGSVRGERLPRLSADVKVFQEDLQAVPESFSLPRDCALVLTEFSVE